jgi:hypothetical protein
MKWRYAQQGTSIDICLHRGGAPVGVENGFGAAGAVRRFPGFEDVTAVDVEPAETGGIGGWVVARVWREHLVELPVGPAWDSGGAAAVDHLRGIFRLDPRSRWGRG